MDPPNPNDALFRSVFSNPEHAAGELRHILGPRLSAPIVWSSLTPCPGSFVDEALRGRQSDLLFTARCGEKAVLLYLLFEHQSTNDPLMAYRILVYTVRIWEQHLRGDPKARLLPPILPVLLHHSERGWTSPTTLHGVIDLDADTLALFAPHLPSFSFLLDDISTERDEALRMRAMTALGRLALFCLRHAREPLELLDALSRWLDLVGQVRGAPGGMEALARIWRYIFVVSNPAEPEDLVKQLIAVVGQGSKEEVMSVADWLEQKGRQEGRLDKGRKMLLKQLRARFGEVPPSAEARIQAAEEDQLDTWFDRGLSAPTLDDVLVGA
jgi:hypothetical protein